MRNRRIVFPLLFIEIFILGNVASSSNLINSQQVVSNSVKQTGAYLTGIYSDLFSELLGKSKAEVSAKIDNAFDQLFYGDDNAQRVYYPVAPDMAYIKDINYNDIRTEGMSYGMMIAVQLNKKSEFDRLWKWAKTYMQHQIGASKDYFAWHCKDDGTKISQNSASDGEEWFVMALFFASARWGDGKGIFVYQRRSAGAIGLGL